MSLRVVAGTLRGRRIRQPGDGRVRPVVHKTRDAIFNILAEKVQDARILDCFAGSGSYGIEAISRGAREACFIELNRHTAGVLQHSLEELDIAGQATVLRGDFRLHLKKLARDGHVFDIVMLDPPFLLSFYKKLLSHPSLPGVFAPDALGVLEFPRPQLKEIHQFVADNGFVIIETRFYGQVGISFLEPPAPQPNDIQTTE